MTEVNVRRPAVYLCVAGVLALASLLLTGPASPAEAGSFTAAPRGRTLGSPVRLPPVVHDRVRKNSRTLLARVPSRRLRARVTALVAPNVGMNAECFPAPPMTAMSKASARCRAGIGVSSGASP